MNTFTHTTAAVKAAAGDNIHAEQLLVHSFGASCQPVPLEDQARELRIQAEGLLLEADMLDWQRTGDFGAHGSADAHQARMKELILQRPDSVRARMAADRGLPYEGGR